MKAYNKILATLAMGSMALASCVDLDTFPQSGSFTEEQKQEIVELDPSLLAADVTGMYASNQNLGTVFGLTANGGVQPYGNDFGYPAVALCNDLNSADMVSPDNDYNWFSPCGDYSDRGTNYIINMMRWSLFYNQIKMANDIIASVPADTDDPTLIAYRGQAKAVRAFDYLNLAPYFQFKYKGNEDKKCVPIVTEQMSADPNNPRATVAKVYELIMQDLNDAIADLEGYRRASRAEVDQQVAYGLRARANLYMENWQEAANDAAKALEGYVPYTREEVSQPRFVASDECGNGWLWALEITENDFPAGNSLTSWPGVLGSFMSGGYSTGVGVYKSINVLLYDLIPDTDVRKGWWVDENLHSDNLAGLTWGTATGDDIATLQLPNQTKEPFLPYTNVKFGMYGGIGGAVAANDWPLMRAEEMILIQAEATAMAGGDGKTILENFVKTYRDPSYTCPAVSGQDFQDEVWFQRRVELWGEGFAFADIMRLGKNIVRVKNGVESNFPDAFQFNIKGDDPYLLLCIPMSETNANPGIPTTDDNSGATMPKPGDGMGLTDGVTD